MNRDVGFYEEIVKNLYGVLEAIQNLAAEANDSNWSVNMQAIEEAAHNGIKFTDTYTDPEFLEKEVGPILR